MSPRGFVSTRCPRRRRASSPREGICRNRRRSASSAARRGRSAAAASVIGGIKSEDGAWIAARKTLATAPSVLFDAVAIAVAPLASKEIAKSQLACAFVADAYAHCKFIAFTADARPLLERALAGCPLDGGCK